MILNQLQLKTLSETLNAKIPDLLKHFSIEFTEHEDRYTFPCPIHGGDNLNGACIYKETGIYRCWTHSCHSDYPQGIIGFANAMLDKDKSSKNSFPRTLDYLNKFLGGGLESVNPNIGIESYSEDIYKQNRLLEIFNKRPVSEMVTISREAVLKNLSIPSSYFIDRGFSKEILVKFDVGDCIQPNKPMSGRAVVPVYDIYERYIGCSGRSRVEKSNSSQGYSKWMHSKGFSKSKYLYGIHLAYESIMKKRKVFLVEGPGDVWRMHEAGFENTVAILGSNLSEDQLTILESIIIDELLICTDNDEAGISAFNQIVKRCGRRFNYKRLSTSLKDIGETPINEIIELFSKYNA